MLRRVLLVSVMAAGPLSAQAFEGVLSSRVPNPMGEGTLESKTFIKGDMAAVVMTLPPGGMMSGEFKIIVNSATGTATILMPMFPGMPAPAGTRGMKMVVDLKKEEGARGDVSATALGTSQTIAGMRCEDYAVKQDNKTTNMCVTAALGDLMGSLASTMGGPNGAPSWGRAFGDRPMAPLKIWGTDGAVMMEITGAERVAVPRSTFTIPEGYIDGPAGMMGGRP